MYLQYTYLQRDRLGQARRPVHAAGVGAISQGRSSREALQQSHDHCQAPGTITLLTQAQFFELAARRRNTTQADQPHSAWLSCYFGVQKDKHGDLSMLLGTGAISQGFGQLCMTIMAIDGPQALEEASST